MKVKPRYRIRNNYGIDPEKPISVSIIPMTRAAVYQSIDVETCKKIEICADSTKNSALFWSRYLKALLNA